MKKLAPYRDFCDQRKAAHQFRTLRHTAPQADGHAKRDGKDLINFAGNDYLGLSHHPALIEKAREYAEHYGAGSTASRLVTGNIPAYAEIEMRLAEGKGCQSALVMNSGYQANMTVLAALADSEVIGRSVTVLADRLCHNSLLQGITLSGSRLMRFKHNDYDHLDELLKQQCEKGAAPIIVSESVFSMDGDRADLGALIALANRYDALLYIDEAHATGLFGPGGFGMAAEHKGEIDVVMGTFGKALGSFGAYIACNALLRDYLVQRCGGLIYSTALPPAVLGSMEAALELLPQLEKERAYLQAQSQRVRDALQEQGWDCGLSTTQIIPVILGDEQAANTLSDTLRHAGILAPAIRPPTVPRGTSRLRLSLSAAHSVSDIDKLISMMATEAPRYMQSMAS
ncbi:MAG TPA: 8-amino-7-oxononanoate synthase [Alphaproteobacteria bacterium]|nr:8-amino-7-oxononanoate synthase [Alphaproteobacteria bacterium]